MGATEIDIKDEEVVEKILHNYDLVFSINCKQIFPKRLVENIRCINFHPGYNPFNRGWFSQVFSINNKLPTGVTIHLMDAEIDHGPIILQNEVKIGNGDTSLDVYKKIIQTMKDLIAENIQYLVNDKLSLMAASQEGNYNRLVDFRNLCELDLDSVGSLSEHLDLLRSLTHGNYKNAYFKKDGKKYYIRIFLDEC